MRFSRTSLWQSTALIDSNILISLNFCGSRRDCQNVKRSPRIIPCRIQRLIVPEWFQSECAPIPSVIFEQQPGNKLISGRTRALPKCRPWNSAECRGTCTGTRGVRVLRVRGDRWRIDARWLRFRVDGQSPLTSVLLASLCTRALSNCTDGFLRVLDCTRRKITRAQELYRPCRFYLDGKCFSSS